MTRRSHEIIVIGGGISGLTAAWQLRKAGRDVLLVESADAIGGYTRTESRDGFLLEKGPFNVIVRDPAFENLLSDVADDLRVVTASPAARKRYIFRHGRLHAVPTNPVALLTTGLLPLTARIRLLRGLILSPPARADEESIAEAAARRFGRETADTLVSAAISGILAGDIDKLSLAACFPSVAKFDADARSLIGHGLRRAFSGKKNGHRRRWRGLVSLDGGLGALTQTLGSRLGEGLLTRTRVTEVEPKDGGFRIECQGDDTGVFELYARRVILASPVGEAHRLLQSFLPAAADALHGIESQSLAVLNLGFRRDQIIHPLEGFGFLVPRNEPDFPLMGVLFADSAFPHHAPADKRLLRVFIGGARDPLAVARSDNDLLLAALQGIRNLLGVSGEPVLADIRRYRNAIPQYHRGHRERIARFREAVADVPGLRVIGNYLEGVSLNDCVRLATRCAEDILVESDAANPADQRLSTESTDPSLSSSGDLHEPFDCVGQSAAPKLTGMGKSGSQSTIDNLQSTM
jgi:oxygen-dependent protoporphyrinogen oxidase